MNVEQKLDMFLINEESAYEKFFKGKLKQWKVTSPAKLSKADKIKFFNEIEKEWTKDKD